MTAITMTYVVNPFSVLLHNLNIFFMTVGYARAASELARIGNHEAAKNCMKLASKLEYK